MRNASPVSTQFPALAHVAGPSCRACLRAPRAPVVDALCRHYCVTAAAAPAPPCPPTQINFEVQRKCPHCVRSAYATHDIQKGGLIALVPLKLAVYLQEQGYSEYDANQEWNPVCLLLRCCYLAPRFSGLPR